MNHFSIREALAGVKRTREENPNQRKAILPSDLIAILHHLPVVSQRYRQVFWTACLVAFHTMVRSANLFADSGRSHTHLKLEDVIPTTDGFLLKFPALKNERFSKKFVEIPIHRLPDNHQLCAVTALQRSIDGRQDPTSAVFSYLKHGEEQRLSSTTFNRLLRSVLRAAGLDSSKFSVHSFRRGAATFASHSGVPVDALKAQGNWRSDCYERYINRTDELRNLFSLTLSTNL